MSPGPLPAPLASLDSLMSLAAQVLRVPMVGIRLHNSRLFAAAVGGLPSVVRGDAARIGPRESVVAEDFGTGISELTRSPFGGLFVDPARIGFAAVAPLADDHGRQIGELIAAAPNAQAWSHDMRTVFLGFARTAAAVVKEQDLKDGEHASRPYDASEKRRELDLQGIEASVLRLSGTDTPLGDILSDIVRRVDDTLPAARSSILLVDDEGRLRVGAAGRLPGGFNLLVDGLVAAEGVGSCGTAVARGTTVVVEDTATSPLWASAAEVVTGFGLRACWSTPVLDATGRAIATFALYYGQPKTPAPDDIALIQRVGQYVRIAVERSRERDRLRLSEARCRSMFNLVPVAVWEEDVSEIIRMVDWALGQCGGDFAAWLDDNPAFVKDTIDALDITDVNAYALELYGADHLDDLVALVRGLSDSEEGRDAFKQHLIALAEGHFHRETEYSVINCKGERLDLLVRMFRDPDEPARVIISESDITARKRAEERFRVVAQATSDVVWEHDLVTGLIWQADNSVPRFGLDPDKKDRTRSYWINAIHPDEREAVVASADAAISSDAAQWQHEYRFAREDGSHVLIRERAMILRDENGKAVRMIGNMVDLTPQKELEEQLRRSQRLDAVGQLTGGIAHDFNNLLTIILGNVDIMTELAPADSPIRKLADATAQAASRGANLTSRLLSFARKQPLYPTVVDVSRVICGMEDMLRRTLTPAIEVKVAPGDHLWWALVDVPQLESAILNLAINARAAMPGGGRLAIDMHNVIIKEATGNPGDPITPGEYVLLEIADSGIGMDSRTLQQAFEPFFTTKPVGEGSGLGLSMVYGFVMQSGGHIRAYSEVGCGTSIHLYLPRAPTPVPAPDILSDGAGQSGNELILLVEDDELVRDYATLQLKALGYRVSAVVDAESALQALDGDDGFDLLFTDIIMPGAMDGRQLAETVARIRPDLPILLTSGCTERNSGSDDEAAVCGPFLPKPYRREELSRKLREVLAGNG